MTAVDVAVAPPAEDRVLSPHTGWTRNHWEHTADQMLAALARHATPQHGRIHLPGPRASSAGFASDGLEGYSRTFLLAAFRLAGAGAAGTVPGDLAGRYAQGLVAGTTGRDEAEAWTHAAEVPQTMVEAASIAIGLHETRSLIWDQLDHAEQDRAAAWLLEATTAPAGANNWQLFQVIVNAFLKGVGAPYDQAQLTRNLDRIDSWYVADGWYSDGPGQRFDHYVGWAMHLYTALWCRMDGDAADPDRAAVYRNRLGRFLDSFALLFGADGAPLHQGRSLTYRFAAAAAPWAGALVDATPLAPGLTRRLASGALRHFLDRGATEPDGLLTLGWHGPFEPLTQLYSGPASPYWASKAFIGLLLPADHPVWTEPEEPLPVETGDFIAALPAPGWLAWGTQADGIVRVANHGTDHHPMYDSREALHYRKLAYSTATGPEVVGDGTASTVDGEVLLLDRGGGSRRSIRRLGVEDGMAGSVWYPGETRVAHGLAMPSWNDRVEVVSAVRGRAEVRAVHVTAFDPVGVRMGGWAVASDEVVDIATGEGRWAWARTASGLTSVVAGLHGFSECGVDRHQESNAFGPHSATPWLASDVNARAEQVLVALVVLTGEPIDPGAEMEGVAAVEVNLDGERREVVVRWADGAVTTLGFAGRSREWRHDDSVIGGAR